VIELVAAVRPGVALRQVAKTDELVLVGGGEVFRLPLTAQAAERQQVLVRSLPGLAPLLPVPVPRPRWVGVLADGSTPFTAERRLPGAPVREPLEGIALSQWEGVLAALDAVPPGQVREWGGLLRPTVLLADPGRGVLTGLVDWR
jgi:aminoglycoside phosphotransferase (APT) family kinase protein